MLLWFPLPVLPCLIFEDEHLLVVNKPAGLNTHAPGPYAGEGLYDGLRHREPRWDGLAIIHRLDKETSGVIVFAKSPLANRSLTAQFTRREVRKKYLLLTDRAILAKEFTAKSRLVRAGEKYLSRPLSAGGETAETRFRPLRGTVAGAGPGDVESSQAGPCIMVEAEPLTGRTHQIRVHAAAQGFPVLGDTLYGGTSAGRVYLHAAEIAFMHPVSGKSLRFAAPVTFAADPRQSLRAALLEPEVTDAFRVLHGASDGWPGWYVDRLGPSLLSQGEAPLSERQRRELERLGRRYAARNAYHKQLIRRLGGTSVDESSPRPVLGTAGPKQFTVRENGLRFELSFAEGYSVGLFLDQRENRRRLLTGHVAAGFPLFPATAGPRRPEVLNTFAYTCGFSVCAANAGCHTTSVDLSRKYLDWGKRNFTLNELALAGHEFLSGDVFDWLKRLAKKQRLFDVILLDPPTFSRSKASGVFRAEKDYGRLVAAALPLLRRGGTLFASTNAADWPAEDFLTAVQAPLHAARRNVVNLHYAPQPPDFPVSRAEPAYLKTVWLRAE